MTVYASQWPAGLLGLVVSHLKSRRPLAVRPLPHHGCWLTTIDPVGVRQ